MINLIAKLTDHGYTPLEAAAISRKLAQVQQLEEWAKNEPQMEPEERIGWLAAKSRILDISQKSTTPEDAVETLRNLIEMVPSPQNERDRGRLRAFNEALTALDQGEYTGTPQTMDVPPGGTPQVPQGPQPKGRQDGTESFTPGGGSQVPMDIGMGTGRMAKRANFDIEEVNDWVGDYNKLAETPFEGFNKFVMTPDGVVFWSPVEHSVITGTGGFFEDGKPHHGDVETVLAEKFGYDETNMTPGILEQNRGGSRAHFYIDDEYPTEEQMWDAKTFFAPYAHTISFMGEAGVEFSPMDDEDFQLWMEDVNDYWNGTLSSLKTAQKRADLETQERIKEFLSPDLLKPEYRKRHEEDFCDPMTGHCYVATEALYHMWGKENGYIPQVIRHEGGTHWYLKNYETGDIIDLTHSQFETPVPYDEGRGAGFLTRDPSKRTRTLMDRMDSGVTAKVSAFDLELLTDTVEQQIGFRPELSLSLPSRYSKGAYFPDGFIFWRPQPEHDMDGLPAHQTVLNGLINLFGYREEDLGSVFFIPEEIEIFLEASEVTEAIISNVYNLLKGLGFNSNVFISNTGVDDTFEFAMSAPPIPPTDGSSVQADLKMSTAPLTELPPTFDARAIFDLMKYVELQGDDINWDVFRSTSKSRPEDLASMLEVLTEIGVLRTADENQLGGRFFVDRVQLESLLKASKNKNKVDVPEQPSKGVTEASRGLRKDSGEFYVGFDEWGDEDTHTPFHDEWGNLHFDGSDKIEGQGKFLVSPEGQMFFWKSTTAGAFSSQDFDHHGHAFIAIEYGGQSIEDLPENVREDYLINHGQEALGKSAADSQWVIGVFNPEGFYGGMFYAGSSQPFTPEQRKTLAETLQPTEDIEYIFEDGTYNTNKFFQGRVKGVDGEYYYENGYEEAVQWLQSNEKVAYQEGPDPNLVYKTPSDVPAFKNSNYYLKCVIDMDNQDGYFWDAFQYAPGGADMDEWHHPDMLRYLAPHLGFELSGEEWGEEPGMGNSVVAGYVEDGNIWIYGDRPGLNDNDVAYLNSLFPAGVNIVYNDQPVVSTVMARLHWNDFDYDIEVDQPVGDKRNRVIVTDEHIFFWPSLDFQHDIGGAVLLDNGLIEDDESNYKGAGYYENGEFEIYHPSFYGELNPYFVRELTERLKRDYPFAHTLHLGQGRSIPLQSKEAVRDNIFRMQTLDKSLLTDDPFEIPEGEDPADGARYVLYPDDRGFVFWPQRTDGPFHYDVMEEIGRDYLSWGYFYKPDVFMVYASEDKLEPTFQKIRERFPQVEEVMIGYFGDPVNIKTARSSGRFIITPDRRIMDVNIYHIEMMRDDAFENGFKPDPALSDMSYGKWFDIGYIAGVTEGSELFLTSYEIPDEDEVVKMAIEHLDNYNIKNVTLGTNYGDKTIPVATSVENERFAAFSIPFFLKFADRTDVERKADNIFNQGGVEFVSATPDPDRGRTLWEFNVTSTSGETYPLYGDTTMDNPSSWIDWFDVACSCDWGRWNYDRAPEYRYLERFPCSHALATEKWLAQSGRAEQDRSLREMETNQVEIRYPQEPEQGRRPRPGDVYREQMQFTPTEVQQRDLYKPRPFDQQTPTQPPQPRIFEEEPQSVMTEVPPEEQQQTEEEPPLPGPPPPREENVNEQPVLRPRIPLENNEKTRTPRNNR